MEFFEALKTFIIDTRSEGLKEVAGTKLSDEYFAHNEGPYSKWHISDIASGLAVVTKLPTLAACKDWLKNIDDETLSKIETARLTDKYKAQCDKVAAFKTKTVESFDFMEAFEALDDLEKDSEQKLFGDELGCSL